MASTDWAKLFPILGKKTYLSSHSLGAVPASTAEALRGLYDEWATLGIAAWDGPWWEAVLGFSKDLEAILHAKAGTVAPMPNATRAMAGVASALDFAGRRNKVVVTDLEFTTFYPFWRAQERNGARLVVVASKDGATVPASDLIAAIDDETLLVSTCHAYFRSGAIQDVAAITKAAHDAGARVLIDGYQAVGTYPIDVARLDVDFYVGGSHKYLCGGAGAGFLYVRPDLVSTLNPTLTGWFGLADPFAYGKELLGAVGSPGVYRFLDGTPNVPGLYSSREGIRAVRRFGIDAVRAHSLRLTSLAMKRADEAGLEVRTPRKDAERSGMVCLEFPGSQAATRRLVDAGIVVDWRPDCGLRLSPHFYNSAVDVERLFDALGSMKPRTGPARPGRPA